MEVVLPAFCYAILVAELVALTAFYRLRAPSAADPIGRAIGWAGVISMCVMHVYSIRRRVRALSHFGKIRRWLEFHIFMGLQGALLVVFHSIHLQVLANLSGVTLGLTLIVVASGIFGRYLYALLPKGLSGERLSARDVEKELSELAPLVADVATTPEIAAALAAHAEAKPLTGKTPFAELVREDLRARAALRSLERAVAAARKTSLTDEAREKLAAFAAAARRRAFLARRLATLTAAERLFRNWHVLHKPLTYLLLGSVILHVAGHYIFAAQFSS